MEKENSIVKINNDSNITKYEIEDIRKKIYTIRGRQVMLDSDVARLFKYETKDLNRNVKNNIDRFPEHYCFQLTEEEYESLRCKIFTLNKSGRGQHRKYLPYVFTEHGITMLAGLLKSDVAVIASIKIVNSFIEMKKIILSTGQVYERMANIEYKILEHDNILKKVLKELGQEENIKQKIFFEGQIWDSYNLVVNLIKRVAKTDKFHHRFIILDNKELYHCGASLKDLGKKCFAIGKIEDFGYIDSITKLINF